ncbi:MAG: CapA family protein [Coriobacteriales bacterium]|nr:CapA family protein [Coriobacteriales bacterium]
MSKKHSAKHQATTPAPRVSTIALAILVVALIALDASLGLSIFHAQSKAGATKQATTSENPLSAQTNPRSDKANAISNKSAAKTTAEQTDASIPESNEPPDSQSEERTKAGQETEPEPEPEPVKVEPASIEVMMIGDVLMHDELVDSGYRGDGSYDFGFLFDHITDYIGAADLRMLNQESVMGEPERGYHLVVGEVGPIMNTPTALADTEATYGFNLILNAHNHVLDLGYSGLAYEMDYWKAAYPQIPVIGVNNPHATADDSSQDYVNNVYVYEHDGLKVGVLNYTWWTNDLFDNESSHQYVSYLSAEKVRSDVEKARAAGAEMLIACPHWGVQYDTEPSEEELTYARLFCDLGVDVIFGNHPHILQPVEVLTNDEGHRTVCFYSMGNFVAAGGMETNTLMGGVARATLQRHEDGTYGVSAASLVPTVICYTVGPHMSAYPLSEWTYELAAESYRSALTPDYAYAFLRDLLGSGFNEATGIYTVEL